MTFFVHFFGSRDQGPFGDEGRRRTLGGSKHKPELGADQISAGSRKFIVRHSVPRAPI
jgi:hypothetical protein